jgi:hypothetical protein
MRFMRDYMDFKSCKKSWVKCKLRRNLDLSILSEIHMGLSMRNKEVERPGTYLVLTWDLPGTYLGLTKYYMGFNYD